MGEEQEQIDAESLTGHAVVAGYGLPGRAVGDLLRRHEIPFCVIELNADTVRRCEQVVPIIEGDVTEEQTLRRGHRAKLALCDHRSQRRGGIAGDCDCPPTQSRDSHCRPLPIHFEWSAGHRTGANEVVVEEQAVAAEFVKLIEARPVLAIAEEKANQPGG